MKKILISLFAIVTLISSLKVSAFSPMPPSPLGIIIEIDGCDSGSAVDSRYFVDVIVKEEDIRDYMLDDGLLRSDAAIPEELYDSEYSNQENEWVSLSLHYMYDNDWIRESCITNYFRYNEYVDELPFAEYKLVVYEEGKTAVVSKVYFTSNLASRVDLVGFKHIYDPVTQTFSLQGYEAEFYTVNPHWTDYMMTGLIPVVVLIAVSLGLLESFIHYLMNKGKKAVLISLVFNLTALAYLSLLVTDISIRLKTLAFLGGIFIIPGIYAGKILLLHKYTYYAERLSVILSGILLVSYIIISIMIFW